jgi:hypothetical protein
MEALLDIDNDVVEIQATIDSPGIVLNRQKGLIKFTGRSLPENPKEFYNPIMSWLSKYVEKPCDKTHVVLNMDYFNTASSKILLDVLETAKSIQKAGNSISIDWHYLEDDEDMLEVGQDFADIIETPFNFIPYD